GNLPRSVRGRRPPSGHGIGSRGSWYDLWRKETGNVQHSRPFIQLSGPDRPAAREDVCRRLRYRRGAHDREALGRGSGPEVPGEALASPESVGGREHLRRSLLRACRRARGLRIGRRVRLRVGRPGLSPTGSSEGEGPGLRAGIEELDLELTI